MLISLLCVAHPSIIWAGFEQHQKTIKGESHCYIVREGFDLQGFPYTPVLKPLHCYRFSIG